MNLPTIRIGTKQGKGKTMVVVEKVGKQYKISINKIPMWLRFNSKRAVTNWLNKLKKSIDNLNQ